LLLQLQGQPINVALTIHHVANHRLKSAEAGSHALSWPLLLRLRRICAKIYTVLLQALRAWLATIALELRVATRGA
jgi:hypothetical protein